MFEILGCFSVARYLATFSVDERRENLAIAVFALRLNGLVKICKKVIIRGRTERASFRF